MLQRIAKMEFGFSEVLALLNEKLPHVSSEMIGEGARICVQQSKNAVKKWINGLGKNETEQGIHAPEEGIAE